MVTRGQVWWVLVKAAYRTFAGWVAAPAVLFYLLILLGVGEQSLNKYISFQIFREFGPLVVIAIIFGAAAQTAYRVIKEDRLKAAEDFYSVSPEAAALKI